MRAVWKDAAMKRLVYPLVVLSLAMLACNLFDVPPPTPAQPPPPEVPTPTPLPQEKAVKAEPGAQVVAYLPSEGIGDIAVRLTFPEAPRYPDGAGVVVDVATFFTPNNDFHEDLDAAPLGLIRVAYLWPGKESRSTGARSDGEYDYGGETSIRALRDVIRFAEGEIPDREGYSIRDYSPYPVLTDQVGLYAFSHPGIAAVNVLALYGDQLNVRYFVGRENPTVAAISAVELGYWGEGHRPVFNPLYRYPDHYSPTALTLDYSLLRWEADYRYPQKPEVVGYPYFDMNENGQYDEEDFILSYRVPTMFGKRVYSAALTQALRDNGALSLGNWPANLATPEEATEWWAFRVTPPAYPALAQKTPDLKVMLLFSQEGHIQPLPDAPQIHQAYDGFYHTAGLWTRLNPDAAYLPEAEFTAYQDHPANTEPEDWSNAVEWGVPPVPAGKVLAPQAAVAEMADRVHEDNWDPDLSAPFFPLVVSGQETPSTPSDAPSSPVEEGSAQPLNVFYVVHARVGNDHAPYTDASLSEIDLEQAVNVEVLIRAIAAVAEKHGFPITWEFPRPLAKGLCAAPQRPHLIAVLADSGHEIGVYAHTNTIGPAYQTLAACGFPPVTLGGFMIDTTPADDPQAAFSRQLSLAVQSGYRYATENLAPTTLSERNPFGALCRNQIGEGNDMWEQTYNLLFPWYPDYLHENICAAQPTGDILLVDHAHADWMRDATGRFVPVLTEDNFAILREWLDGALAYMDANQPGRPAAWGFVSHLTEYTFEDDGTGLPAQEAINALDDFLAYLESLQAQGKIRLVTVREIGETIAP